MHIALDLGFELVFPGPSGTEPASAASAEHEGDAVGAAGTSSCSTSSCIIPLVLDAAATLETQADAAQQAVQSLDAYLGHELSTLLAAAVRRGDIGLGEQASSKTLKLYLSTPDVQQSLWCIISLEKDASPKALHDAVSAAAALVPSKNSRGDSHCDVYLPSFAEGTHTPSTWAAAYSAVLRALEAASYVYTATKSDAKPHAVKRWRIHHPTADMAAATHGFKQALALARGLRLARELGNRPPNSATPKMLAEVAQELAQNSPHAQCQVLERAGIVAEGMGAFAAVAQGSEAGPRFIVLEYTGPGADAQSAPLVLVGKGITFDSGGISLKPGQDMDYMKYDMCGAASVLGTMTTLIELAVPQKVVALIPTCENLPSGRAVKPGDVVTSHSGLTVEVLNTDAEGRLILCDALSYAKRYQPRAVIDIATLTGACVIALGGVRAGMFASQDALAEQLLQAGEAAYDLCWRMPLDEEYAEGLKSKFADIANIAGRAGGSITAAKFLQRFAQDYPWAHLDIAGVAWKEGSAKGATARPVSLLVHYVLATSQAIA